MTCTLVWAVPVRLFNGRGIAQKHYEMVADEKLKLPLGTKLRLGLHDYTVVGLTRGIVGSGGDPVGFFSLADAQEIQFVKDNWAIRNFRERARAAYEQALPTQPTLSTVLASEFADNPDLHTVNAVVARLDPQADPQAVAAEIGRWKYFTAYPTAQESQLMLAGSVALARRQTALFRWVLSITATVIIAQIIYNDDVGKTEADRTAQTHWCAQPLNRGAGAAAIAGVRPNCLWNRISGGPTNLRQMAPVGNCANRRQIDAARDGDLRHR
jgi:putative ABC transport system permease protein